MVPAQDQHTAQGSRSVNNPPQAQNRQPILRPINPVQSLAKYRIACCVDSVYYYPNGRDTYCAVVLEVGFLLSFILGEHFISALFPTRVPDTRLDRFPDVDEVVKMDGYNVKDGFTLAPNIQAAGVGVTVGTMNRQTDRMVYRCLRLLPQRKDHDEIRWQFINQRSHYFPSAVKLLLLVRGENSEPNFSFKLEILSSSEVHAKTKWWHVLATKLRPGPGDGWNCEIENDYRPEIAKSFLDEYQKPREERKASQMCGLHAAVISYAEEFQR